MDYTWKFISKKGVVKSRKRKSESMIEKGQQKGLKRKWNKKVFGKNLGKGQRNAEIQKKF